MPALILDTSTERGFVAIIEGENILFHAELPFGLQNSQFLLPEIDKGLKQTKLAIADLSFVGVGIGPGSYTGIRVGATVAKTLTFASRLPLVGVCSLDAFIPAKDAMFASVIDAKIGGLYLQKGQRHKEKLLYLSEPQVYSLTQAVEILRKIEVIVTPNATQLRPKLEILCKEAQWEWQESYPSPRQMGKVAIDKFARSEFSLNGHIDLMYLRKTQAEMEKEQRDEGKKIVS